jgi:hypothetical protein
MERGPLWVIKGSKRHPKINRCKADRLVNWCHKRTHALQHVHISLPSKIAKPSRSTENQSSAVNLAQSPGACYVERVRSPLPPTSQGAPVLSVESIHRATLGPQMRTATVRN